MLACKIIDLYLYVYFRVQLNRYRINKNITKFIGILQSGLTVIDCDNLVNVVFFLQFLYDENGTYYDLGYIF